MNVSKEALKMPIQHVEATTQLPNITSNGKRKCTSISVCDLNVFSTVTAAKSRGSKRARKPQKISKLKFERFILWNNTQLGIQIYLTLKHFQSSKFKKL